MKRGDIAIAAVKGDYGKPRPVLVVQADQFADHTSVTIAMMTSTLIDFPEIRLTISPSAENGLAAPSQVQLDKLQTVPIDRLQGVIGNLDRQQMTAVDRGLALFLGIA